MFSSIKLWLYGAIATTFSILFALLKYKSNKLERANEIIKELGEEAEFREVEKVVTDRVAKQHREVVKVIEEEYDEMQIKAIETTTDKPISDELLKLLKQSGRKE